MAGEHAARGASDELLERVRDKIFAIVADLIEEAYRMTAPKRLVAALNAQCPGD